MPRLLWRMFPSAYAAVASSNMHVGFGEWANLPDPFSVLRFAFVNLGTWLIFVMFTAAISFPGDSSPQLPFERGVQSKQASHP
jgi:hypothetical protein